MIPITQKIEAEKQWIPLLQDMSAKERIKRMKVEFKHRKAIKQNPSLPPSLSRMVSKEDFYFKEFDISPIGYNPSESLMET